MVTHVVNRKPQTCSNRSACSGSTHVQLLIQFAIEFVIEFVTVFAIRMSDCVGGKQHLEILTFVCLLKFVIFVRLVEFVIEFVLKYVIRMIDCVGDK